MFQALKKCSCRLSGSSEKRAFERRNSTGLMSFYNEGLTLLGTTASLPGIIALIERSELPVEVWDRLPDQFG